jgi:hypothetical protein
MRCVMRAGGEVDATVADVRDGAGTEDEAEEGDAGEAEEEVHFERRRLPSVGRYPGARDLDEA